MTKTITLLRFLSISFLLLSSISANAQMHFKVGYTPAYLEPEENNKLLQSYNERNPWLRETFDDLNWIHGLDVGLRYRIGFVALEASWRASFANKNAEGRLPTTNAAFQKKLIYRFNTYTFGLENYIGPVGLGVSLGYNRMTMKERTTDDRIDILKTDQWIGTIYLGLYTNHDGTISFALRPFVQIPIDQFDISKLADNLGEPDSGELLEKNYMTFGLSLVIFNGY
ncbi:MAG: hypothetical protein ACI8YQ_003983 [Polaribacter sp.]|jgi:hypothetical protein